MSSAFWKSVLISPVAFGFAMLLSTRVMAAPSTESIVAPVADNANSLIFNKASGTNPVRVAAGENPASKPQVDPTDDVASDVKPGQWQYTALQGIATKYDCNANLNNKPVTQIEFARGLNACLNTVEPLLAQQPGSAPSTAPGGVTREDLEVLKRLTQEYRAQLSEIDGRLVNTDKKVAQLQANQFSTTTKLKGEAVFNVTSLLGGGDNNIILGDRVRLLFQSSFTGKDILWTRLATGNQISPNTQFRNNGAPSPSPIGAQVVDANLNNAVGLDWLAYQFPVSNSTVYVAAFNGLQSDYAPTFSVVDDFTGAGLSVSAFAEDSPIYKIGGGTGAGITVPFAETGLKSATLGYFAFGANNPSVNNGIFGNNNSLLAQLNFQLSPQIEGGLTYINSSTSAGSSLFGGAGVPIGTNAANISASTTNANSYGAAISFKPSETLNFSGFAMTSSAKRGAGTDNIWSYGAALALPNIDGKGSLAGLTFGAEPYVGGLGRTPFQLQGFYKYKFSDNIAITPALIYVTSTDETNSNSAVIGVIRTTFTF
ncbi:iron uptake porin [Chamaesiphon sp. OTE_8_metabat_110]|uniref:iron uptake porin n=1 Tax=Chamaesiphon sp. OTE_8_metabat_110 TaxID=2964696 RepID=UPI00286AFD47|nr:iron uptake porin [Chamaesiphon sp. OTE_8_metabat_110]